MRSIGQFGTHLEVEPLEFAVRMDVNRRERRSQR